MASTGTNSGRQFEVDSVSGQIFYREPMGGFYTSWTAMEPSDYHPPRPASHNVFTPGMHHPASVAQGVPHMSAHGPPYSAQPSTHVQERQNYRATQRSTRAHNPVRSRQPRLQEGGKGHGRTRGSPNYRPREIEILLDYVEAELPVGAKGWNAIGARFREWVAMAECPSRTDRSLEAKFKQLVRTRKPTGDAACPPEIERAHEIDDKIQAKVACRDLADDEIADFKDSDEPASDDADDETPAPIRRPQPTPRVRTTRQEATPATVRQPPARGLNVLDRLVQSLDPGHQAQRDAERNSTLFQSQQLILFQSQIRDLNQLVQTLRTQLDDSERRRMDADRRADRLENQIYVSSIVNQAQVQPPVTHPRYHEATTIVLSDSNPSTPNSDQEHRWEATFRDGGRCSWNGNVGRLNSDSSVVEVNAIPWSPSQRSPARSPPTSDSD